MSRSRSWVMLMQSFRFRSRSRAVFFQLIGCDLLNYSGQLGFIFFYPIFVDQLPIAQSPYVFYRYLCLSACLFNSAFGCYIPMNLYVCMTKILQCDFTSPRISENIFPTTELLTKFYTPTACSVVHISVMLQKFIQLCLTLTKLCQIKCDRLVNFYISLRNFISLIS